jgi:hypothetical protein
LIVEDKDASDVLLAPFHFRSSELDAEGYIILNPKFTPWEKDDYMTLVQDGHIQFPRFYDHDAAGNAYEIYKTWITKRCAFDLMRQYNVWISPDTYDDTYKWNKKRYYQSESCAKNNIGKRGYKGYDLK